MGATANPPLDRVAERRHAVALARHYREADGMSIAQIGERLGRAPATIKGYFYDPRLTLTKGPTQAWRDARRVRRPSAQKADPGSAGRNARRHGVAAPTRRPIHPALERAPRLVDRVGASVCGGGLNIGVHATPREEEQPWR